MGLIETQQQALPSLPLTDQTTAAVGKSTSTSQAPAQFKKDGDQRGPSETDPGPQSRCFCERHSDLPS